MLYQRTAGDLIHGFHDWVKQQPPTKRYDYSDGTGCAFATYLKAQGYSYRQVNMGSFSAGNVDMTFPPAFADAIFGASVEDYKQQTARTFRLLPLSQFIGNYGDVWTYGQLDQRLTAAGY